MIVDFESYVSDTEQDKLYRQIATIARCSDLRDDGRGRSARISRTPPYQGIGELRVSLIGGLTRSRPGL